MQKAIILILSFKKMEIYSVYNKTSGYSMYSRGGCGVATPSSFFPPFLGDGLLLFFPLPLAFGLLARAAAAISRCLASSFCLSASSAASRAASSADIYKWQQFLSLLNQ